MLFTRCSQPVHKRFGQPQASVRLDRKSYGDSSPVLQISSEQTISIQTTSNPLCNDGRIRSQSPIPKLDSKNWLRCFGKESAVVQDGRCEEVEQADLMP